MLLVHSMCPVPSRITEEFQPVYDRHTCPHQFSGITYVSMFCVISIKAQCFPCYFSIALEMCYCQGYVPALYHLIHPATVNTNLAPVPHQTLTYIEYSPICLSSPFCLKCYPPIRYETLLLLSPSITTIIICYQNLFSS